MPQYCKGSYASMLLPQSDEVTGSQAATGAANSPAQTLLSYSAVVSRSAAAPKLHAVPNQVVKQCIT